MEYNDNDEPEKFTIQSSNPMAYNDEPERFTIQSSNPMVLISGVHSAPPHSSRGTQVVDESIKPEGSIMLESQGAEDYVEAGEPSELEEELQEQVEARIMSSNPSESD